MELTAPRFLLASLPVVVLFLVIQVPVALYAQRIVSFPSVSGYASKDRAQVREFPRRKELLQALDFLEEYERGKLGNDWTGDYDGALDTNEVTVDGDYPAYFNIPKDDDDVGEPDVDGTYYDGVDTNGNDIPYWAVDYPQIQGEGGYPVDGDEQQQQLQDWLSNFTDEQLLELVLDEEKAEEEEQREEDEVLLNIIEEEMENLAIDNILDDLMSEELLQRDAENQLAWLLDEEEAREEEEEEEEEDIEDPFIFEYFYGEDGDAPSSVSAEEGWESSVADVEPAYVEYPESSSEERAWGSVGEQEQAEEMLEEAAEMLQIEDEEEQQYKELSAQDILQDVIGRLTREAIEAALDEDSGEYDVDDERGSLSLYGGQEEEEAEEEEAEEEIEQEVYKELIDFLSTEIELAVQDVADDILEEMDREEEEQEQEAVLDDAAEEAVEEAGDSSEAEDYEGEEFEGEDYESSAPDRTEEEVTSEGLEQGSDDVVCSSLQYFIDDCNIVNNYADLGAEGYKELFTGACNRHQLCYACGSFYEVGSKLCDELFRAEMLSLCGEDDKECTQRAKYFWLVARNNRIPLTESPSECAESCLLDALVNT